MERIVAELREALRDVGVLYAKIDNLGDEEIMAFDAANGDDPLLPGSYFSRMIQIKISLRSASMQMLEAIELIEPPAEDEV